jgi:hypothetical protein
MADSAMYHKPKRKSMRPTQVNFQCVSIRSVLYLIDGILDSEARNGDLDVDVYVRLVVR